MRLNLIILLTICITYLSLVVASCGKAKHLTSLIHNGEIVTRGEHPWKAALHKYSEVLLKWGYQCGGVLINQKFVVTGELMH